MHDFHSAQDEAHRQSRRLIALFIGAVALLLLLTNLLVAAAFIGFDQTVFQSWERVVYAPERLSMAATRDVLRAYLNSQLFPVVSLVVLAGVGLATAIKALQISAGGTKVAQMLGGVRLAPDSVDPRQRKLLNVVEEMAIASGMPVPSVFLLPDHSINAFAAGFSSDDAVIGVTQGSIDRLDRAELQGVIAHEFSHILNGDMRLNMRLIAVLGGIVFIATAGRILMRASGGRGRRGRDATPIVLLGLALVALGWIGVICGRMIKASLSRQREYLADASAVQFTRNPAGLAGALKKIAGVETHGRVGSPRAEEVSHLFFAQAVGAGIRGLFATHPPLSDRIRRLDPQWQGELAPAQEMTAAGDADALYSGLTDTGPVSTQLPGLGGPDSAPLPTLPAGLIDMARTQRGAGLLVFGCLTRTRAQTLSVLRRLQPALDDDLRDLNERLQTLDPALMVPLLELAMPALAGLDHKTARTMQSVLDRLYKEDGQLDLLEIMIASLMERHLPGGRFRPRDVLPRYRTVQSVRIPLAIVLSALGAQGALNRADVAVAVNAALGDALPSGLTAAELGLEGLEWAQVADALARLRRLYPLRKPPVMRALVAVLAGIDIEEGQREAIVHLLAGAIDCPWDPRR